MSSLTITANESCANASAMDSLTTPQFSAMSEHSSVTGTPDDIAAWLTLSQADSPASRSPSPASEPEPTIRATCGPPRWESFAQFDQDLGSLKIRLDSASGDCGEFSAISTPRVMAGLAQSSARALAAEIKSVYGCGFVPTVRASDGTGGPCLSRPSKDWTFRDWVRQTYGRGPCTPELAELLMAFPIGWTACEPLATDKFRSWLHAHGRS